MVIHGGEVFSDHEQYIQYLHSKEITLDDLRPGAPDWKRNLQDDLGDNYDVLFPKMPNGLNAKYAEWKIIFEKIVPLLDDGVVFVGHSLGGSFLVKYFSENKYQKSILSLHLAAPAFKGNSLYLLDEFDLEHLLDNPPQEFPQTIIYHSTDDPIVPFSDTELFKKVIPYCTVETFSDRLHFFDEHFPELVNDIKKSSK